LLITELRFEIFQIEEVIEQSFFDY
jgi:hypothetical protein